jgi:hypothetical protein
MDLAAVPALQDFSLLTDGADFQEPLDPDMAVEFSPDIGH